jgi:hypothetical protein
VHRHALERPLARVGDVVLLRYGVLPGPHPEARRKEEVIAWELVKLRVLKEHELGVSLEYDRDDGLYYAPEAEKQAPWAGASFGGSGPFPVSVEILIGIT